MKNLLLLTVAFLFSLSLSAQKIEFEFSEINYGEIEKGAESLRTFKFKNTGDAPLIISDVKRSCGCTTPKFTNTPVMPGETGEIQVSYDTQRMGYFHKTLTVSSNAKDNETATLQIKGTVVEKPATPVKEENIFQGNK